MPRVIVIIFVVWAAVSISFAWLTGRAMAEDGAEYVGPEICQYYHPDEYDDFVTYSKMVKSFENILLMKKNLPEEEFQTCFECHTTGYGEPGGFISEAQTPHLKNIGCETCHGPGSFHAETGEPEYIRGRLSREFCEKCHNDERVTTFRYKPMIFGGVH
ncbi:hypothetical protein LCGC14_2694000 [marine sediment metagenome]|uniref:Cytochrome c-552/4 domain-containing protein n=1 Tax=marine sediment metagenome TaxID=412755 RepID=A0A0F9A572_9ZZZZ